MPAVAPIERKESLAEFLQQDLRKDLLRFTTAGSVDDGKSTLIGRLLHDAKAVYEDQVASVKKSKINRSGGAFDLALLYGRDLVLVNRLRIMEQAANQRGLAIVDAARGGKSQKIFAEVLLKKLRQALFALDGGHSRHQKYPSRFFNSMDPSSS